MLMPMLFMLMMVVIMMMMVVIARKSVFLASQDALKVMLLTESESVCDKSEIELK